MTPSPAQPTGLRLHISRRTALPFVAARTPPATAPATKYPGCVPYSGCRSPSLPPRRLHPYASRLQDLHAACAADSSLSLRLRRRFKSRLPRLARTPGQPRLVPSAAQCSESRTRGLLSLGRYSLCDMARKKQTARASTGSKVSRREIATWAARRAADIWRSHKVFVFRRHAHRAPNDQTGQKR